MEFFNVEERKHSFKITDPFDESKVLFVFEPNELPDSYNWDYITETNQIRYQDGHQTNQIFGTYLEPIEFSGKFSGLSYDAISGQFMIAKDKSEILFNIFKQAKPVKVIFGMGDWAGNKSIVIIKHFKRTFKSYHEVEYSDRKSVV